MKIRNETRDHHQCQSLTGILLRAILQSLTELHAQWSLGHKYVLVCIRIVTWPTYNGWINYTI